MATAGDQGRPAGLASGAARLTPGGAVQVTAQVTCRKLWLRQRRDLPDPTELEALRTELQNSNCRESPSAGRTQSNALSGERRGRPELHQEHDNEGRETQRSSRRTGHGRPRPFWTERHFTVEGTTP